MILRYASMCFSICILLAANLSQVAYASGSHECGQKFLSFKHDMTLSADETTRGDIAEHMANYIQQNDDCGKNSMVVSGLVALLSDRNDSVRWGAAEALANISPPAKRAVPALKKALRESDAALDKSDETFLPTRYSGQAIRQALKHITGKTVPDYSGIH